MESLISVSKKMRGKDLLEERHRAPPLKSGGADLLGKEIRAPSVKSGGADLFRGGQMYYR